MPWAGRPGGRDALEGVGRASGRDALEGVGRVCGLDRPDVVGRAPRWDALDGGRGAGARPGPAGSCGQAGSTACPEHDVRGSARVETGRMRQTDALLDRFLAGLAPASPLAVWAHGSLPAGDYVEGRSDLDLIAVLPQPPGPGAVWRVAVLHNRLRAEPLAGGLHCTYLSPDTADDAGRRHLTWAHELLLRRPVTPVTRAELHTSGRVLHGAPPADVLPPVPDGELAAFVLRDQRAYWRPYVDRADLWTRDVWVDLGMLTHARAAVTLREGRLISKREALDVLPGLGAPEEVVEDIRARRYGGPVTADAAWPLRRAALVRGYLGPAIDALAAGS